MTAVFVEQSLAMHHLGLLISLSIVKFISYFFNLKIAQFQASHAKCHILYTCVFSDKNIYPGKMWKLLINTSFMFFLLLITSCHLMTLPQWIIQSYSLFSLFTLICPNLPKICNRNANIWATLPQTPKFYTSAVCNACDILQVWPQLPSINNSG